MILLPNNVRKSFPVIFESFILTPLQNNHSQVWLFEQWDMIPTGISISLGDSHIVSYSGSSVRGSSKLLETNGWYNICSYSKPTYYLHIYGYSSTPHIYPVDGSYFKTYGSVRLRLCFWHFFNHDALCSSTSSIKATCSRSRIATAHLTMRQCLQAIVT